MMIERIDVNYPWVTDDVTSNAYLSLHRCIFRVNRGQSYVTVYAFDDRQG
jgi:hypothetical protein